MMQMGRCVCLLPVVGERCCRIIGQFDDQRCSLCGMGRGLGVKDSSFVWQWWCIDCAVMCLEDRTRMNLHAEVCSLDANHSGVFENIHWSSESVFVDLEEKCDAASEYYADSEED